MPSKHTKYTKYENATIFDIGFMLNTIGWMPGEVHLLQGLYLSQLCLVVACLLLQTQRPVSSIFYNFKFSYWGEYY